MRPMRVFVAAAFVAACTPQGGNETPAPAAPTTAAAATAPPVAAAVGPDGPSNITVPADLAATVAAGDAAKGEALFASKGCVACHKVDATRLVGPGLAGVTQRRPLGWVARMILKPEQMVKDDPEAKKLFATYMTPMANQSVDPVAELPHLIAFLKTKN